MSKPLKTEFASAERSSQEALFSLSDYFKTQEFLIQSFNAFPDAVLVLDRNRQIVFANAKAVDFLDVPLGELIGKRPGEAIGCVHAKEETEASGCGTTKFCRQCGAVRSILTAQGGCDSVEECAIFAQGEKNAARAFNLRVWSVPFQVGAEHVTVVTMRDIALEKRLEELEKIFFHDVLNCAGILKGYSENFRDGLLPQDEKPAEKVLSLTQRMIDMIQQEQMMIAAEQGDLFLNVKLFDVCQFLRELCENIKDHPWGYDQQLLLECACERSLIASDKVLLGRSLMNLIKNAFESSTAAKEDRGVILKYGHTVTGHLFSVHNFSFIPEDVQLQIFERAFSTKGRGRGTGTYSVKLFTEQYLGGKVFFKSHKEEGTTFFVQFPARKAETADVEKNFNR